MPSCNCNLSTTPTPTPTPTPTRARTLTLTTTLIHRYVSSRGFSVEYIGHKSDGEVGAGAQAKALSGESFMRSDRDESFSSLYAVGKLLTARMTRCGYFEARDEIAIAHDAQVHNTSTTSLSASSNRSSVAPHQNPFAVHRHLNPNPGYLDMVILRSELSLDMLLGFCQFNVTDHLINTGAASVLASVAMAEAAADECDGIDGASFRTLVGTDTSTTATEERPVDRDTLVLQQSAAALTSYSDIALWADRRFDSNNPLGFEEGARAFPEPHIAAALARSAAVARGCGAVEGRLKARSMGLSGALVPNRGPSGLESRGVKARVYGALSLLRNQLAIGVSPRFATGPAVSVGHVGNDNTGPVMNIADFGWRGSGHFERTHDLILYTMSLLKLLKHMNVGVHPLVLHRVTSVDMARAPPTTTAAAAAVGKVVGVGDTETALEELELEDDIEEWDE